MNQTLIISQLINNLFDYSLISPITAVMDYINLHASYIYSWSTVLEKYWKDCPLSQLDEGINFCFLIHTVVICALGYIIHMHTYDATLFFDQIYLFANVIYS